MSSRDKNKKFASLFLPGEPHRAVQHYTSPGDTTDNRNISNTNLNSILKLSGFSFVFRTMLELLQAELHRREEPILPAALQGGDTGRTGRLGDRIPGRAGHP